MHCSELSGLICDVCNSIALQAYTYVTRNGKRVAAVTEQDY